MSNNFIKIIVAVGVLLLMYLLACFVSPSSMSQTNEIKINCSKGLMYVMINDIKEWPNWISWKKEDSNLSFSMGGRQVNIGANFTFEGKSFGKGIVEVQESHKDSLLASYITNSNWPGKVSTTWQIIPETRTSVLLISRNRLLTKVPFFKRPFYWSFEKEYANLHQNDLNNLKNYIEGMINTQFGIKPSSFKKQGYFGMKAPIYNANIPKFYAESYPKIYKALDSLGITPSGPPVGLIYDWEGSSNYVYIMAALPVDQVVRPPLGFDYEEVPDIPCLKLEHFGSYKTLKHAHSKLDYIMSSSNFVLFSPIIEEYVTSPSQEPDTSKWLTNIYYLLDNTGSYSKTLQKKKTIEEMIQEEEEIRKKKLERENQ